MIRRQCTVAAAILSAVLFSNGARADWAWTKWDMTPDEVVAASGSRARTVAQPRTILDGPVHGGRKLLALVDALEQWAGLNLKALFLFDPQTKQLACVSLDIIRSEDGLPGAKDAHMKLRAALVAAHGEPTREIGTPMLPGSFDEQAIWLQADFIELRNTMNISPYVRYCKRARAL